MLFNSYTFLFVFLPLVLIGWWGLRRTTYRFIFLTLASYVFYGWWDWRFVPMLMVTTAVDYIAGRTIGATEEHARRKRLLIAALAANLGLLGFFKYESFFVDSLTGIGSLLGVGSRSQGLSIVLPIGISFYTFNSISYTIDVYRRRVQPEKNLLRYSGFVALFPHLVSGPIVRYADIEKQLKRPFRRMTPEMASRGLTLIALGLAQKLLIADRLAPSVDRLFAEPDSLGLVSAWFTAAGYSMQLFFDFCGYSDVAIGTALLLGFRFPQNFNAPFKARNISDFWRRWHISLSRWMRDYIFIPLGGSHGSKARTARNLTITMFLGGLWHGAAWTFVVWGLYHGVALATHAVLKARGLVPRSKWVARAITFAVVITGFVIFRAPDLTVAGKIIGAMLGANGFEGLAAAHAVLGGSFVALVIALVVLVQVLPSTWELQERLRPRPAYAYAFGVMAALVVLQLHAPSPFIYFQF